MNTLYFNEYDAYHDTKQVTCVGKYLHTMLMLIPRKRMFQNISLTNKSSTLVISLT